MYKSCVYDKLKLSCSFVFIHTSILIFKTTSYIKASTGYLYKINFLHVKYLIAKIKLNVQINHLNILHSTNYIAIKEIIYSELLIYVTFIIQK